MEHAEEQKETERTEAKAVSEKKRPPPLQADVEQAANVSLMSGAAATCEGERLFMVKFNLSRSDTSSGEAVTAGFQHCSGASSSARRSTSTSRKHVASCASSRRDRAPLHVSVSVHSDQQLREAAGVWVSLSRSAVVGDACCCDKARARRGGRHRSSGAIYDRSNAYRGGGTVASAARQHRATAGIEQGQHGALLVYALMESGSLQDHLACRGSGALVPLTANERILVLSDVARGLVYLHSEVCVIHRDVKSANVLNRGCQGRVGDFGIARSLNDNNAGIAISHMQTERVMGTQVYMATEYMRGELSMKVDAFAVGLVILETLTGFVVCSLAPGTQFT